jgi:hypothetical protein
MCFHSDVDANQTYRIREIKGSPQKAFYGRECSNGFANPAVLTSQTAGVQLHTTVFGYFKVR